MLLKDGLIYTAEDAPFRGDLLIRDGKIAALGQNLAAGNEEILDLKGKSVVPGFIDISTNLGLMDAGHRLSEGMGVPPSDKYQATAKMVNGINWRDEYFDKAWQNGVTTVVVNSPYNRPLGGQSCALKTAGTGTNPEDRVISTYADMHGTMGNRAKNDYDKTRFSPLSRMGLIRGLRDALTLQDSEYSQPRQISQAERSVIEALQKKQVPLKLTAAQEQDILSALDLAEELGLSLILDGVVEYPSLVDRLKEKGVPLVLTSLMEDGSFEYLLNRRDGHASLLEKEGVPFCLSTHHPDISVELYHLSACLFVREGVSEKAALEAMTINPARALGLDDRIGSLKEGKDGDILIFDGNPLHSLSVLEYVFVNGEMVEKERS